MHHLLRLDGWTAPDLFSLFKLAREYEQGRGPRVNGCAVLFFPPTSLRTRVSFERGAAQMGLQPITLPPETLDKPEALGDVAGYLAQWADIVIARHPRIEHLDGIAAANELPVVNAMTDANHPCEALSDLYALSASGDPLQLRYLFVGADGNIARAWQEAARAFQLDLVQSCPPALASPGAVWNGDLRDAVSRADVIITDGPGRHTQALASYQITTEVLSWAPRGARLAPCPPFLRGREVSSGAIDSEFFVGYEFKSALLPVQQAVMALLINSARA